MDSIFPRADIPTEPDEPSSLGVFRWIVIGVIVLATGIATFHWVNSVRHERATAVKVEHSPDFIPQEGSPLIGFTKADIKVNHRWTLLAGRHPTVRFSCRLSPTLPPTKLVFLCYRPLGAAEWDSIEAFPRRDKTCHITLRDLHRDMPYECFFIAYTKDMAIQSNTVVFSTGRPTGQ